MATVRSRVSDPAMRVENPHPHLFRFGRFDHDKFAHRTFVEELDAAGDLGKQSVVLASSDVQSRLYARPALTNDDGAAWHELSAKRLEPKPLRVRVAPVS
jgi:hypothetical protein